MVVLLRTPMTGSLRPGRYEAEIVAVSVDHRNGRECLRWTFRVRQGERVVLLRRRTTLSMAPRSTARLIVEAALGRRLEPGEVVDARDLVGLPVRLYIANGGRIEMC